MAAQALAVIRARFDKPEPHEIEDILERAKQQARAGGGGPERERS